jgi:hypothetical protein
LTALLLAAEVLGAVREVVVAVAVEEVVVV